MRCFLLVPLLACMALTGGCRKHRVVISPPPSLPTATNTLVEGTVIKGAGNWVYSDGSSMRSLDVNPDGTNVHWAYNHHGPSHGGSTSSVITTSTPSSPWFIYVESAERLWIFDGTGSLICHFESSGGSATTLYALTNGKLQNDSVDVPPEVIPLLPEELQTLFPKPSKKPRPSI